MQLTTLLCILPVAFISIVSSAHAEWRKYVGLHYSGFETYSFYECGSHKRWWLEPIDEADNQLSSFERELRLERESAPQPENELSKLPDEAKYVVNTLGLYVEAKGFLSPVGNYGHLGNSDRQLTVRKIYEIREASEEDYQRCR